MCNGASNITHITMLPTYLQAVHGVSATLSGVYQLPVTASNITAMFAASMTISKTGQLLPFLYAGPLIYLLGAVLIQQLQVDSPLSWVLGAAIPVGAGFGFTIQGCILAVQNACSTPETREDMPVAATMEVFSQQLGRSVAISVAQSVFVQKLHSGLKALAATEPQDEGVLLNLAEQGLEQMVRIMDTLDSVVRAGVKSALSTAMTSAFILPVAAMALASVATLLVERRNIDVSKKPAPVVAAGSGGGGEELVSSTVQETNDVQETAAAQEQASPGDAEKRV
jgi:hypothetical protein